MTLNREHLRSLLERFKDGETDTDGLIDELLKRGYEDIEFAKVDHRRQGRTGYPEVIYGEGKTPEHAAEIFSRLAKRTDVVICTRASQEMADAVIVKVPGAQYRSDCRIVIYRKDPGAPKRGLIAIACAGTSDIGVAEEAAVVCEAFGSRVERLYDVGVAGLHRLLGQVDVLNKAKCVVAVAGMEGALPSVLAGLVDCPVIAVPTSVGYGASFGGIAALLAMLNSCAPGVSVVNIDNGFGAALQADMINKLASPDTDAEYDQDWDI
jgi:NCAIR mutase (PurE)-related protein